MSTLCMLTATMRKLPSNRFVGRFMRSLSRAWASTGEPVTGMLTRSTRPCRCAKSTICTVQLLEKTSTTWSTERRSRTSIEHYLRTISTDYLLTVLSLEDISQENILTTRRLKAGCNHKRQEPALRRRLSLGGIMTWIGRKPIRL